MPDGQREPPVAVVAVTRPRLRWIDGAKGIGIVLVVYGHAARALYAGAAAPGWYGVADRLIYAFHMPLFFVVAGLFVWPSLARGRGRFVRDKLVTIVWPYFLWSLVEGAIELTFTPEVNSPISLRDLAMIPVTPIEQFWFLYVLSLCLLLALACFPRRIAVAAVAAGGLAIVARYGSGMMVLRALVFFPYVAIGILCAASIRRLADERCRTIATLVVGGAIFAVTMASGPTGVIADLVAAVAGSAATLAAAALIDRGAAGAPLALLGRASLAIYVMHTVFSAGLRIAVRMAGIAAPAPALLVATTIAGIAGPLAVWLIAERYGLSTLLGLGRDGQAGGARRGSLDRADRTSVAGRPA